MTLHIYNTLSRKKEPFVPLTPGQIRLYVCGMTVYDYCHIGHARVMVAFDVITRFLRSQNWEVEYVRNVTDIDDKIIQRAAENNEEFSQLTARFIDCMHQDERSLGVLAPDQEPHATAHMDEIIAMVEQLVAKDFAYQAKNGDVYYRIKQFADYGKLSNKNPDELLAGARIEVGDIKDDPRDFALWKIADEATPGWKSPWGWGRPGWHIECSAMTKKCLGDTFDIHGGGPDLPFPHHENEIAQSEAANGCRFVNYWMHAGAVRVDGEKMSKSLGNFFTIREVLKKYPAEVVRFLLISSHYRSPINYSEENLIEAKGGLERFYLALRGYENVEPASLESMVDNRFYQRFVTVMNDDFNTREALAAMYELVRELNQAEKSSEQAKRLAAELLAMGRLLGILEMDANEFLQASAGSSDEQISGDQIDQLIIDRSNAKKAKDYALADQIRNQLTEQGIVLEDSAEGTSWRRS